MENNVEVTLRDYLDVIEEAIISNFGDEAGSDVFLSETKSGIAVNLLIGAGFETDDINQVNIILVPTDVSEDYADEEETNNTTQNAFDVARGVL